MGRPSVPSIATTVPRKRGAPTVTGSPTVNVGVTTTVNADSRASAPTHPVIVLASLTFLIVATFAVGEVLGGH